MNSFNCSVTLEKNFDVCGKSYSANCGNLSSDERGCTIDTGILSKNQQNLVDKALREKTSENCTIVYPDQGVRQRGILSLKQGQLICNKDF